MLYTLTTFTSKVITMNNNNNQAAYCIVIKTNGIKSSVIPYDSRERAVKFLDRLVVKFPEYSRKIMTDLNQVAGVALEYHSNKSTYMIKKAG